MSKKSIWIKNSLVSVLTVILLSACGGGSSGSNENPKDESNLKNNVSVSMASDTNDYERLGLKKEKVEAWEDAFRSTGKSGSYEWWYCDYTFDDGTTVVVTFYTKIAFDTHGSASPSVTINIVYPDKTELSNQYFGTRNKVVNASREVSNVHIGNAYIENRDGKYFVHYSNGEIEFSATMISVLPMWRQDTGFLYFGEEKHDYFSWLVAQPSSKVTARLTVDGVVKELKGDGYHDHNWGNSPMHENMDNWYWGRVTLGEYTLIFSEIIAHKKYNYRKVPLLFIAKGDKVLNIDTPIKVERNTLVTNNQTHKSYAKELVFKQTDESNQTYTIEVKYKRDLAFLDMTQLPFKTGNKPTYLRTLSDVSLSVKNKGKIETFNGVGVVEQMSFEEVIEN